MAAQISYNCPVLGNDEDYQDEALFIIDQSVKRIINSSGVTVIFPKPKINDPVIDELFSKTKLILFWLLIAQEVIFKKLLQLNLVILLIRGMKYFSNMEISMVM